MRHGIYTHNTKTFTKSDCCQLDLKKKWNLSEKMQTIKIVCIGDGSVGKTSLLSTFATNKFPNEYEPTVFDNYSCNMIYNGQTFNLQLWDTAGQEDYANVRSLSYTDTDIFLICYSCISPSSYKNITSKWMSEITSHCPSASRVLVSCKIDCLHDESCRNALSLKNISPLLTGDLETLKKEIKAFEAHACSAKTGEHLTDIFILCIKAFLARKTTQTSGCSCVIG